MEVGFGSVVRSGRGALLELVDERGEIGFGEATPLAGFSIDDADRCVAALRRFADRRLVVDVDTDAPGEVARVTSSFDLAALPAARAAIETALLDLIGKRRGVSIARCLAGSDDVVVPVNGLVFLEGPIECVVASAVTLVEAGLGVIKAKVRARTEGAFAAELERLRAIRAALPKGIELRLDANGAWSIEEARARLDAVASLAPRYVEQPVAALLLADLGRCAVPWAADESLVIPEQRARLLASEGCAAFVLKPTILGLLDAFAIGRAAQRAGLDVSVTHAYEGPVGMAAASELARALATTRAPIACGLDPHVGLAARRATVPQLARRGRVIASTRPGLGLTPEEARG